MEQLPYLKTNLIGMIVTLLAYTLFRGLRRSMLISALCLLPFSLLSAFHEKTYWSPRRLGNGSYGIEDIIFCFSVGSLVWFMSAVLYDRSGATFIFRPREFGARFLAAMASGALVFLIFSVVFGIDAMSSGIISQGALGILLLARKRRLWKYGIAASIGYTIYYFFMLLIFFYLFPDFRSFWNGEHIWKAKIAGIPAEEICWVFTFSLAWSMAMAHSFTCMSNTKPMKSGQKNPNAKAQSTSPIGKPSGLIPQKPAALH